MMEWHTTGKVYKEDEDGFLLTEDGAPDKGITIYNEYIFKGLGVVRRSRTPSFRTPSLGALLRAPQSSKEEMEIMKWELTNTIIVLDGQEYDIYKDPETSMIKKVLVEDSFYSWVQSRDWD